MKRLTKRKLTILASVMWIILSAAVWIAVITRPQTPVAYTAPVQQTLVLNADTIFTLVNNERIKAGLKPLVRDARLDRTAQLRADDMKTRNYFSHFDPATGEKLVNIGRENPGMCSLASENISNSYYADSGEYSGYYNVNVIRGWMNSKPHHDAILDTRYTHTGVAVNGDKVVQHFCIAK